MPEPTAPVVEGAAPILSPAVDVPPPTIPNADKIFEAIKDKIKEANPELAPKKFDMKTGKPIEPPADKPPELKGDPKMIRMLGTLQGDKRTLEARVKELEPFKADAELAREVKSLWEKGGEERLAALSKLTGKDGLDVLAELVAFFYEKEQESADAGGTPGTPPAKPGPEMAALMGVVEGLRKELADLRAGKDGDTKAASEREAAEAQKAAGEYVTRFIGTHAKTFELCARPDNQAEAVDLIQNAALAIVTRDKVDISTLTAEQADALYLEAAGEVEAEYEQTGRRFTKTRDAGFVFDPSKYGRKLSVPAVTLKRETLSKNPREAEAQVRARLLAKYGG
jgi:hypothetical protein